MLDLRETPRKEIKNLSTGEHFINEDGQEEVVTFVSDDKCIVKSQTV